MRQQKFKRTETPVAETRKTRTRTHHVETPAPGIYVKYADGTTAGSKKPARVSRQTSRENDYTTTNRSAEKHLNYPQGDSGSVYSAITGPLAKHYSQGEIDNYWDKLINEADRYGIPYTLAAAMVWQESNGHVHAKGDPDDYGRPRSFGLLQVQPATAKAALGYRVSSQQLLNPDTNIEASFTHLKNGYDKGGSWREALRYYNGSYRYADEVLAKKRQLDQEVG